MRKKQNYWEQQHKVNNRLNKINFTFILLTTLIFVTALAIATQSKITDKTSTMQNLTLDVLTANDYSLTKFNEEYFVEAGNAADIQTKINLCSSGNCKVNIPAGTYALSSPIRLSQSGIQLSGAGAKATLLTVGTNETGIIIGDKSVGYNAVGTVKDLKISTAAACAIGDSQIGLFINYSKFNIIHDVDITGLCGDGIKLDNWARYNRIYSNNVQMESGNALHITSNALGNQHNLFYGNRFGGDHTGTGLYYVGKGSYNKFLGNLFQSTNGTTVTLGAIGGNGYTYYNTFEGNTVEYSGVDNIYSGIYLNGTLNSSIKNNMITGAAANERAKYCIELGNQAYNDISGNKCERTVTQASSDFKDGDVMNKEQYMYFNEADVYQLNVTNNAFMEHSTYENNVAERIKFTDPDGSGQIQLNFNDGTSDIIGLIVNVGTKDIYWHDWTNSRRILMYDQDVERVGVNDTTPDYTFDVDGTSGATEFHAERGTQAVAAYQFSDANDGWFSPADNEVKLTIGGSGNVHFRSGYTWYGSNAILGLLVEAATATNPNIVPRIGDMTSGIGASADGHVNIIAGGNDMLEVDATTIEYQGNVGISDSTSYWLCTAADCSTKCQVTLTHGAITGCT